jgi:hypothetical protein
MVQRCGSASFVLEAEQAIGIRGKKLRQDLDCDLAIQPRIARAIHLAHTARPERRENFILPKNRTGNQSH